MDCWSEQRKALPQTRKWVIPMDIEQLFEYIARIDEMDEKEFYKNLKIMLDKLSF